MKNSAPTPNGMAVSASVAPDMQKIAAEWAELSRDINRLIPLLEAFLQKTGQESPKADTMEGTK